MRPMLTTKTLAFAVCALVAACKQGVNERCQVNSDCAAGLQCAPQQGRCFDPGNVVADASTVIGGDARNIVDSPTFIDAFIADAYVVDARPDAPPPPSDAALPD